MVVRPWLFALILCCTPVFSAGAQALQVLVGMNKPPYIQIETADGYEIELLRALVGRMGAKAEFTHVPNKRIQSLLQQNIGDMATLQPLKAAEPGLFYSCPYIRYQNVVVSLEMQQLTINQLADLKNLSVLAFQNATAVLGEEFRALAQQSFKYRETVEQRTQVESLHKLRVQAVVMDINIFYYHHDKIEPPQEVQVHALFPASYYRVAFRDKKLADAFNQAMLQFWQSPEYQQLQQRYLISDQSSLQAQCPTT
ncbi:ABC transporter substrate-binding protein [Rheinheimera sp.]|uniref:substrate-binding periplasmic protein n=1 Tax=Rheinheimera sp. TaxID=1869214 RepID=UPI0027B97634|nr:transporter substrate-binding domain-containing protein [Rheinheimera sp.]